MISKEKFITFIITFITILFILLWFLSSALVLNLRYSTELEYKNKIIVRGYGKNFDSYEDYLLWRIEKGE